MNLKQTQLIEWARFFVQLQELKAYYADLSHVANSLRIQEEFLAEYDDKVAGIPQKIRSVEVLLQALAVDLKKANKDEGFINISYHDLHQRLTEMNKQCLQAFDQLELAEFKQKSSSRF